MILYSNGCPNCNVLKDILDKRGVDYTINNVTSDEAINLGFRSMPMLLVNNKNLSFRDAIKYINGGNY